MSFGQETIFDQIGHDFETAGFTRGELMRLHKYPVINFLPVLNGTSRIVPIELIELPAVISNGLSGNVLVRSLEISHIFPDEYATHIIERDSFVAIEGAEYHPVAIKGVYFSKEDRVEKVIRETAWCLGLLEPPVELACLLIKKLLNQDFHRLGIQHLVVMHSHQAIHNHDHGLLGFSLDPMSTRHLNTRRVDLVSDKADATDAFVFLAPVKKSL